MKSNDNLSLEPRMTAIITQYFINFLQRTVANVNINNDEEEGGSEIFAH
jgi:hypothetical protein